MKVEVFLFGKKKDSLGWIEFLSLEKVPFRYLGVSFKRPGKINIVVKTEGKEGVSLENGDVILRSNTFPELVRDYSFGDFQEFSEKREFSIKRMRQMLLKAFYLAGLPYVHLWYYPFPAPSILLFRQDIDYVEKKGIRKTLEVTERHSVKGTYFVNVSGEEQYDEAIGHLELGRPTTPARNLSLKEAMHMGNELANHGYWHYVFDNATENSRNIRKGNAYLKRIFNVAVKGFASPGAEWNKSLLKALEKSGLIYACNGCSDRVGFPFHPHLERRKLRFLELVFYRICDASFERLPENAEMLSDILDSYANSQIRENKPIAILAHPNLSGNLAEKIYLPIFKRLKRRKIPSLTISAFSEWWLRRDGMELDCSFEKGKLVLEASEPAYVRIVYKRREIIVKVDAKKLTSLPIT